MAGDMFTGAITFVNTMSLGTETTGVAVHDFYSAETQLLSIGQAYTTLKHSLSLISYNIPVLLLFLHQVLISDTRIRHPYLSITTSQGQQ